MLDAKGYTMVGVMPNDSKRTSN